MELITLKSSRELDAMRRAGRIAAQARALAGRMVLVRPGVTTHEIDTAVRKFIESQGAKPSFLGYAGFSGSACISVNQVVIHGIPSKKVVLHEGDIVSVDVGACIDGFHGDCAATYACGQISDEAKRLIEEYYGSQITLEEAARQLSVSPEYLSRQYKKETGLSFSEDLRRLKVEKVKTLLIGTTLNLTKIAAMTGFSDPKYMSRVFKEEVGVLPAEYRKMSP